jgi:DNA end-binding protein Ku
MAARHSWEGFLRLNLISVPVKAYSANASGRGRIGFHQIHAGCGSRIRHQKVCPIHGEVSKDEIVPGYEYAKNQYVIVGPDEIKDLRGENEKAITIDVFIPPEALDAIYYTGRSYYLAPDGKVGQQPYAVLCRAMSEQNCFGMAQVFFSGRRQLAAIRPVDGLLVMTLLSFAEQIKKPAAVGVEPPDAELPKKEMELARTLVRSSTDDEFDIARYHDEYEADLKKLIEAKAKGKKLVAPRAAEEPVVINFAEALKKSVGRVRKGPKRPHRHRGGTRRKTG